MSNKQRVPKNAGIDYIGLIYTTLPMQLCPHVLCSSLESRQSQHMEGLQVCVLQFSYMAAITSAKFIGLSKMI